MPPEFFNMFTHFAFCKMCFLNKMQLQLMSLFVIIIVEFKEWSKLMSLIKRLFLMTGIFLMCVPAFSVSAAAYDESSEVSIIGMLMCGLAGALIVGAVVAMTLVSMSRTKKKSTQADHYITSEVKLTDKQDRFLRKETTRLDNK